MAIIGLIVSKQHGVNCNYHNIERGGYQRGGKMIVSLWSYPTKAHCDAGHQPLQTKNWEVPLEQIPQRIDFREALYAFVLGLEEFVDFEIILEEGQVLEQPIVRWTPPPVE